MADKVYKARKQEARNHYSPPRLVTYGTASKLTAAGSVGSNEGSGTDPAKRV